MIVINAIGKSCPMPIVEIARERMKLSEMATFQVFADDSAFPNDIRAWCAQTGSDLVQMIRKEDHYEAVVTVHPVKKALRFGM